MNRETKPFKSKQEIANELKICVKTLREKLKKKGITIPRGLISPHDQARIKEALGVMVIKD